MHCEHFSQQDWEILASRICARYHYSFVYGCSPGGLRLEQILKKRCDDTSETLLLVDGVYRENSMMEQEKKFYQLQYPEKTIKGVVVVAMHAHPEWIDPIFITNFFV